MTQKTNQKEMWRALFQEQHARLAITAETLLCRRASIQQILSTALTDSKGSPFDEFFGRVSALHVVVKAAIAFNYRMIDRQTAFTSAKSVNDHDLAAPILGALPWPEHAVYFLSEILRYSRRDVALLLGISDTNVDQLIGAEKRIELPADAFIPRQSPRSSSSSAVKPESSRAFASSV